MKREIKFRGLRTDDKGWCVGVPFPITGEDKCFIIDNCQSGHLTQEDSVFDGKEVTPRTVSQFTGLKDKNGVDVYEGDLVKLTNVGYGFNTGIVVWGAHGTPSFTAEQINEDFPSTYHLQVRPDEIEILGNIHEHKHLLK